MKKILTISLFLFLISTSRVVALENWSIENFNGDIQIKENGEVRIIETIETEFGESMHGIYRDIPYVYQNKDGTKRYTEIRDISIKRDSLEEEFKVYTNDHDIRIRIGDPNKEISGSHTYEISYTAVGVLDSYQNFDEIYWNVTGNGWDVQIKSVQAKVILPKDGLLQFTCYQGSIGSKETCTAIPSEDKLRVDFRSSRELGSGEGMTVAVGFTKGLVPILEGKKPPSFLDKVLTGQSILVFSIISIVGVVLVTFTWFRGGRDFWFKQRFFGDSAAKSELKPIGGHETIVVEFSPPDNLRPAEIGALKDQSADNVDFTATLVDLATRNFLDIQETPKKGVFGKATYTFTKKEQDQSKLYEYEKELLIRIFAKNSEVRLSELKNKFYKDLEIIKQKLYQHMVEKGYFVENPVQIKRVFIISGTLLAVVGLILLRFSLRIFQDLNNPIGLALILVGAYTAIISQFMPRRTALGRQLYVRSKGYEMFIEKAEKYRQQFFEKRNMFNEVLPYAIVFGATEKLAKAIKEMGLEPEQPSWYHSNSAFNAAAFGASMAGFSNSFSTTISSSPSSSGSAGGGSSGGGAGGGGGGGW